MVAKPFAEGFAQRIKSVHWNTGSVGFVVTYTDNGYPAGNGGEVDNSLFFNVFVVDGELGYHLEGGTEPITGGHPAPIGLLVREVWSKIKDNYLTRPRPKTVELRAQVQFPEGTVARAGTFDWHSWKNKSGGVLGGMYGGFPNASDGVLTGPTDAQRGGWSATLDMRTGKITNARIEDRDRF